MKLNPNITQRETILRKLEENDGYCPCIPVKSHETLCPCVLFKATSKCICGLYVRY